MAPGRRLLAILSELPAEAMVTVGWLRDKLGGGDDEQSGARPFSDLRIEEAAKEVGRAPSTVRTWCNSGALTGAYRLRGREWRIPRKAIARFLEAQTNGNRVTGADRARREMDSCRGCPSG